MKNFIKISMITIVATAFVIVSSPVNATTVNIANPASVNCLKLGGKLIPQKDSSGGEYANCTLPDGTICEEWKLFRSECGKTGSGACANKVLTTTEKSKLKTNIKNNLDTIKSNWQSFHSTNGVLVKYIKKALKKSERKLVTTAIQTSRDDFGKALDIKIKAYHTRILAGEVLDLDKVKTELNTVVTDGMRILQTKLAGYVDVNKQDVFDKFITERIATMKKNVSIRLDSALSRKLFKQCKDSK